MISNLRIRLKIFRYNPERDVEPKYMEYEVDADPKESLLNLLLRIRADVDPTFAFSYSCRRGVCGSCAIRVNGIPMLACQTTVEKIATMFGHEVVIEPLSVARVIRDLVIDGSSLWRRIVSGMPIRLTRFERYVAPEVMDRDIALEIQRYRKCITCLACLDACPVYSLDPSRFRGPLAMRFVYRFVADPRDSLDRVREACRSGLYLCLVCDACTAVCYHGIEIGEAVVKMRMKAFEERLAPSRLVDALEGIKDESFGNPLWIPRDERSAWLEGLSPNRRGDVLIFAGCMASYVDRESVRALAKILEIAGIEYQVLGSDEYCCGMPLYLAGDLSGLRMVAEKNLKMIRGLNVRLVITPCPSCYRALKSVYPRIGIDLRSLGLEILHSTQFLYRLLNSGKLTIAKPIHMKLTYHDPCDLGRHEGVYREPRELLRAVGAELIEMKRWGPYARCCGAGGNLRIVDPELSISIGITRLREIPENVKTVVHACPTCRIQFSDAAKEAKLSIENISIHELLLKAILS